MYPMSWVSSSGLTSSAVSGSWSIEYGGRKKIGFTPSFAANKRSVTLISFSKRHVEISLMLGCVSVWLPISWPSSLMRFTNPGSFSEGMPMRKNVAGACLRLSMSSICGV